MERQPEVRENVATRLISKVERDIKRQTKRNPIEAEDSCTSGIIMHVVSIIYASEQICIWKSQSV